MSRTPLFSFSRNFFFSLPITVFALSRGGFSMPQKNNKDFLTNGKNEGGAVVVFLYIYVSRYFFIYSFISFVYLLTEETPVFGAETRVFSAEMILSFSIRRGNAGYCRKLVFAAEIRGNSGFSAEMIVFGAETPINSAKTHNRDVLPLYLHLLTLWLRYLGRRLIIDRNRRASVVVFGG